MAPYLFLQTKSSNSAVLQQSIVDFLKTRQLSQPKQQECQMLGHWQSSAYQQYIMTPREQLATFSIGN